MKLIRSEGRTAAVSRLSSRLSLRAHRVSASLSMDLDTAWGSSRYRPGWQVRIRNCRWADFSAINSSTRARRSVSVFTSGSSRTRTCRSFSARTSARARRVASRSAPARRPTSVHRRVCTAPCGWTDSSTMPSPSCTRANGRPEMRSRRTVALASTGARCR